MEPLSISLSQNNLERQCRVVSSLLISLCMWACDPEPASNSAINTSSDASTEDVVEEFDATVMDEVDTGVEVIPDPHGQLLAGVATRGHADGIGGEIRFDGVTCLAYTERWLWFSDTFNGTLRRMNIETGEMSTMAGRPYELAVVDGTPEEARFESPRGCTLTDASHPLGPAFWVADRSALRKVTLSEDLSEALHVTTILGRAGEPGSVDGVGVEARLGYLIHHMTPSPNDPVLYLADRSNDALREVRMGEDGEMTLTTLQSGLNSPGGLAWSAQGLLIANTFDGQLMLFDVETGEISVIADGLGEPQGICADDGLVWVAGFEGLITRIALNTGETSVLAGVEGENNAFDGSVSKARLGGTFASLVCDLERTRLLYMDIDANALRAVSTESGQVSTVAGASNPSIMRDGPNERARFGLLTDVVGVLEHEHMSRGLPSARWFVADPMHSAIRVIDEVEGVSRTLFSGRSRSSIIVDGPLETATADMPIGLAYDDQTRSLYVSDAGAHIIRRVDLEHQEVITIAGQAGQAGTQDGERAEALFDEPLGITLGDQGLLYIVDGTSGVVRSLALSTGEVRTISDPSPGLFDLEISDEGWLYATNEYEATLVRLTPGLSTIRTTGELGRWEIVAGESGVTGPADGPDGLLARPLGLTKGPDGQLLISDADNHRIRTFSLIDQSLSTFVGHLSRRGGVTGISEFLWDDLTLYDPYSIAWLGSGRGAIVYEGALLGLWNSDDVVPIQEPLPPPPDLADLPTGDFTVNLKRGQTGEFPLVSGDALTLHRGCQGAQHAWVGIEVQDISEEPSSLRLTLIDSEAELASLYLEGEPWTPLDPMGYELIGLTFVIYDPSEVLERELMLGVEITLPNGQVGYGWRPVLVGWGEDACGG